MSSVKSEPLYGQVKVLMVCGFDIIFFFRDLSEMISSLRREHLKRDTFQFIVKRYRVLEDALRRMQKPTFDVDLEVMVRSIQFFHNALLPSYVHMYIHVSPFRFPLLEKMVMIVEGLLESSSHCCPKKF